MSAKIEAADGLRTLAAQFQHLFTAADMLAGIGSAEQAAAEAEARRDAAVKTADEAVNALADAHGRMADAETKARAIVDAAHVQAAEAIAAGQAQAQAHIDAARVQIQMQTDDAARTLAGLQQSIAQLTSDVAGLSDQKTALLSDIAEAEAKRDGIRKLIQAMANAA